MSNTIDWITLAVSIILSALGAVATSFLTLGKYKEKVNRLEENDKDCRKELKQLATSVAVLDERIQNIQKSVDNLASSAQSHSPIQLTDKGWKMVKDSGAYKIFEDNRDRYLTELENSKPRSQYDAQDKAYRIMSAKFNAKEFQPIQQWAFDNGKTVDEIVRILGYPLRDYYFEKHPEVVNPNEKY